MHSRGFMKAWKHGIASTVMAGLIGTTQPTAWKVAHAFRKLMDSSHSDAPILKGIVELDEKYAAVTPPLVQGVLNKRRKGTAC